MGFLHNLLFFVLVIQTRSRSSCGVLALFYIGSQKRGRIREYMHNMQATGCCAARETWRAVALLAFGRRRRREHRLSKFFAGRRLQAQRRHSACSPPRSAPSQSSAYRAQRCPSWWLPRVVALSPRAAGVCPWQTPKSLRQVVRRALAAHRPAQGCALAGNRRSTA